MAAPLASRSVVARLLPAQQVRLRWAGTAAYPPVPRWPATHLTLTARPPTHTAVRCFASKGTDKSWGEIAEEAAVVAKDVASKVTSGVSKVLASLSPTSESAEQQQRRRPVRRPRDDTDEVMSQLGLPGGLLGRALGKVVGGVFQQIGAQLQETAAEVADVQQRAARIIEGNAAVRAQLGGDVQVLPATSNAAMREDINGRRRVVVTLMLPVVGPGGRRAQAEVRSEVGSRGGDLRVRVMLPNGQVVNLDEEAAAAAGQTIDVEYRTLDD